MPNSAKTTHIVGAGLAGLSAAVELTEAGRRVVLYEAGPQAGGRCRSYFDDKLDCRVDNGNHLLMSGNEAALAYLALIDAADSLEGPKEARFPFLDLRDGRRWEVRPNHGPLPWWIFSPRRRVPGTSWRDYLTGLRIARAPKEATVGDLVGESDLFKRFWEPLAVAALNTEASAGAAHLLWPVLKETFGRGARWARPLVAREGLSESFIDPATKLLAKRGCVIHYSTRIRGIGLAGNRAERLDMPGHHISLTKGDTLIVATPPNVTEGLLPDLTVPTEFRPIVNAHFRLPPQLVPPGKEPVRIIGLIGGLSEWVFLRGDLASVTISAATHAVEEEAEDLAPRIWAEVAQALKLGEQPMPPWRIVKEKRATFAQTTEQVARRPDTATRWENVMLAGDWTNTGLPATIEGAIRSGVTAARAVLNRR